MNIIKRLLAVTLFVFFLGGCGLFSDNSLDSFEMKASILFNDWEGAAFWDVAPAGIQIYGRKTVGNCDFEHINMHLANFTGKGTYPVYNTTYSGTVGCDVLSNIGSASDTSGTVTITSYDEAESIIEGEFRFEVTANYNLDHVKKGERFLIWGRFKARPQISIAY